MKWLMACCGVIAALLLAGCDPDRDSPTSRRLADEFMEDYFEAIEDGEIGEALEFYSSGFFRTHRREDWRRILAAKKSRNGSLKSYKLVRWNYQKRYAGRGSPGVYWDMDYEVSYAKSSVDEKLKIYKPFGEGPLEIIDHEIVTYDF